MILLRILLTYHIDEHLLACHIIYLVGPRVVPGILLIIAGYVQNYVHVWLPEGSKDGKNLEKKFSWWFLQNDDAEIILNRHILLFFVLYLINWQIACILWMVLKSPAPCFFEYFGVAEDGVAFSRKKNHYLGNLCKYITDVYISRFW